MSRPYGLALAAVALAIAEGVQLAGLENVVSTMTPDPTEATDDRHFFALEHNRLRVACVGDSITWGLKAVPIGLPSYPELLQQHLGDNYEVLNYGHCTKCLIKNGDDPYWATDEYKWSVASQADMVIIMLGTNDARNGNFKKALTDYVADYLSLIKTFQNMPSKPKVFIAVPPPIVEGEFSPGWNQTVQNEILPQLVKEVAEKAELDEPINVHGSFMERCPKGFYDTCDWISDDGIHPTPEGYVGIASVMSARISSDASTRFEQLMAQRKANKSGKKLRH